MKRNLYLQNKFYNVDLNYRRGLIMGVSITIDSKYVELKNRLIGHKSISFKEQYKVVWRLYNGLTCKIDYIAFKKLKYGYSSYIKEISMMKKQSCIT